MTRRTTRPSLFPYTTLFRSENRRHARVKAPEEAGLHSPADLVCAGAEPALEGTDDGHADDPRPGLGGGHLPGAVRVADPRHRQLEPCHRLRDHDDRLRHDHALALTPRTVRSS